jgi:nucleoside-triphosphatase
VKRIADESEARRHVLLTGRPGVGKTTVICRLAERLGKYHPRGFYTEEIRVRGVRKGFRVVTLDGREQVLSRVGFQSPYHVSRYGVDVEGFEKLLVDLDLTGTASKLIIIDEIGKMECFSRKFQRDVKALLNSSKTLVATVAIKGEGLIRDIKRRKDCHLVTVTTDNRDDLVEKLQTEVTEILKT